MPIVNPNDPNPDQNNEIAKGREMAGSAILVVLSDGLGELLEGGSAAAKGISVIGPRDTYRVFAKQIGAKFLDVTNEAWTWTKNEEFLAGVVKRGDDVIFAGKFNPKLLEAGTALDREINYLIERGYKWTSDFSKLVK